MALSYFALRLIALRPDFAQTITADERAIMEQQVKYWKDWMEKGRVVVFGPVMDPAGTYGFGVVLAEDEAEVKDFICE